jgi:hypothetical protein
MGPLSKHRLKLIEPLLIAIVAPESRRPFELRDARVEGTMLVMGRAEIAEASGWLVTQSFQDRLSDARFADAWLRVATIIDGLALAMIDGEVGLGGSCEVVPIGWTGIGIC